MLTRTKCAEIARKAVAVGASQDAGELEAVLHMVAGMYPGIVVEIGCDTGGTLYAWNQVCPEVYGITLEDNSYATGGQGRPLVTNGANVLQGDSHNPKSLEWLSRWLHGRPVDVLVLDGDHHVPGILMDLGMYGPLVRKGGLILLHDINSRNDARAEVWKVWPDLTREFRTSQIMGPYGWGVIHVTEGAGSGQDHQEDP